MLDSILDVDMVPSHGTGDIAKHAGPVVARNDKLYVIDCHKCGYAHLLNLPAQGEVDAYYTTDKFYSTYSPPDWFQRETQEHQAGLWTPYYKWEARHFPEHATILDIGCGMGWFSWIVRHTTQHFRVGVEPSEAARTQASRHGMHLLYPTITEARKHYPKHATDSVRMRLVLEHLLDPQAMLLECQQWVGARGRLELVVPNELNPLQNVIRKHITGDRASRGNNVPSRHGTIRGYAPYKDWFVQAPHINYFTKQSIKGLLERTGWRIVDEGATFPTELWWLLGQQYIGNDKLGHQLHMRRLQFEYHLGPKAFELYRKLYQWFGIGRELLVFAKPLSSGYATL